MTFTEGYTPGLDQPQAPVVSDPTDADLCVRIAAGSSAALGQLFDRHGAAVRRFLLSLGVNQGEVDDLVQLTFLDALAAAKGFDGRASAKPWLLGIAAIQVRRHRRSLGRWALKALALGREAPAAASETPDLAFERHAEAGRARRALARLSDKKREVFVLVALEGASCEDAARSLGVPVGTVWTRLHHARAELRAALSEASWTLEEAQ